MAGESGTARRRKLRALLLIDPYAQLYRKPRRRSQCSATDKLENKLIVREKQEFFASIKRRSRSAVPTRTTDTPRAQRPRAQSLGARVVFRKHCAKRSRLLLMARVQAMIDQRARALQEQTVIIMGQLELPELPKLPVQEELLKIQVEELLPEQYELQTQEQLEIQGEQLLPEQYELQAQLQSEQCVPPLQPEPLEMQAQQQSEMQTQQQLMEQIGRGMQELEEQEPQFDMMVQQVQSEISDQELQPEMMVHQPQHELQLQQLWEQPEVHLQTQHLREQLGQIEAQRKAVEELLIARQMGERSESPTTKDLKQPITSSSSPSPDPVRLSRVGSNGSKVRSHSIARRQVAARKTIDGSPQWKSMEEIQLHPLFEEQRKKLLEQSEQISQIVAQCNITRKHNNTHANPVKRQVLSPTISFRGLAKKSVWQQGPTVAMISTEPQSGQSEVNTVELIGHMGKRALSFTEEPLSKEWEFHTQFTPINNSPLINELQVLPVEQEQPAIVNTAEELQLESKQPVKLSVVEQDNLSLAGSLHSIEPSPGDLEKVVEEQQPKEQIVEQDKITEQSIYNNAQMKPIVRERRRRKKKTQVTASRTPKSYRPIEEHIELPPKYKYPEEKNYELSTIYDGDSEEYEEEEDDEVKKEADEKKEDDEKKEGDEKEDDDGVKEGDDANREEPTEQELNVAPIANIEKHDEEKKEEPLSVEAIQKRQSIIVFERTSEHMKEELEQQRTITMEQLPDLRFEVIKLHHKLKSLKRQKRVLLITSGEIQNCKRTRGNNVKVTKSFKFERIKRIMIVDANNFIIQYEGEHAFYYQSPMSLQISQLITSRISKKRHLAKTAINPEVAVQYQTKLHQTGDSPRAHGKSKSQEFAGDKYEQKMWRDVTALCLDTKRVEGNAIRSFIHNFTLLEKNPSTAVSSVRQFLNGIRDYIIKQRFSTLEEMLATTMKKSATLPHKEIAPSSLVDRILQRAVISTLRTRIEMCLIRTITPNDPNAPIINRKAKFEEQRKKENFQPEEFFSIPKFVQAPDAVWQPVIDTLNSMDLAETPAEKLDVILASAKCIYICHNEHQNTKAHENKGQYRQYVMNGDDFLPLFIYCIARSTISNPLLTLEFLIQLSDNAAFTGEMGYYLTCFNSAVSYLYKTRTESKE